MLDHSWTQSSFSSSSWLQDWLTDCSTEDRIQVLVHFLKNESLWFFYVLCILFYFCGLCVVHILKTHIVTENKILINWSSRLPKRGAKVGRKTKAKETGEANECWMRKSIIIGKISECFIQQQKELMQTEFHLHTQTLKPMHTHIYSTLTQT